MRSLPVPGRDARQRRRERDRFERAYAATGERIAVAEDQHDANQSAMDKIRAAMELLTRKGDTP